MLNIKKLDYLINKSGIKKTEFIKRAGLTAGSFYNSYNNGSFILATLERFATILKVPVSVFFMDEMECDGSAAIGVRYFEMYIKLKITQAEFAKSLEISENELSNIIEGNLQPNYKIIGIIAELYPEINLNWLLTGSGRMINEYENQSKKIAQLEKDKTNMQNLLDHLEKRLAKCHCPDEFNETQKRRKVG